MVSEAVVRAQFEPWNTPNPVPFLESLPENIKATVSGVINPCAGTYTSPAACVEAFGTMASRLGGPPESKIVNVVTAGDYATIELTFKSVSKKGNVYDQIMCFVAKYEGETIREIRLYIDTAVEKAIFDEAE